MKKQIVVCDKCSKELVVGSNNIAPEYYTLIKDKVEGGEFDMGTAFAKRYDICLDCFNLIGLKE